MGSLRPATKKGRAIMMQRAARQNAARSVCIAPLLLGAGRPFSRMAASAVLSRDDVKSVANLARLELAEFEADRLTHHLNDLLTQFARLQELDTEGVPPTSHAVPVRARL